MRAPLHIQQASAGSGKTYALTKTYIRLLISKKPQGEDKRQLRKEEELWNSPAHILAVTFTNKATNEMKHRIVTKLYELSKGCETPERIEKTDYLKDFMEEFGATAEEISDICAKALRILLLNYSDFQVSTIDSFFQSILRTFTYETDLNDTFNLEIDSDYLAMVSVDNTLDSLVTDKGNKAETNYILQDLMEKSSGSNHWNVYQRSLSSKSLYNLLIENTKKMDKEDYKEIRKSLEKYFSDPSNSIPRLINQLKEKYEGPVKEKFREMVSAAKKLEKAYKDSNLQPSEMNTQIMEKIKKARISKFDETKPFIHKTGKPGISLHGDLRKKTKLQLYPIHTELDELYNAFAEANTAWREELDREGYKIWKVYEAQLSYLALLNIVSEKKREYLASSNIVELSDTNTLLQEIISDDEIPFIYERMGTRINHYLIDEFQDTSMMQWKNMEPLLSESISVNNDNLIIGDAKQSIYRFRNADHTLISRTVPELYRDRSDWSADPICSDEVKAAEQKTRINTNWRSELRVVEFNNYFFRSLSSMLNEGSKPDDDSESKHYFHEDIRNLYTNCVQPPSKSAIKNHRGYVEVNLQLKPTGWDETKDGNECTGIGYDRLGETINSLRKRGLRYRDIGVLVRTNKQGNAAVDAITKYNLEHPGEEIPFISDQSLLVERALSVQMIVRALEMISNGDIYQENEEWDDSATFDIKKLRDIIREQHSLALTTLIEAIIQKTVPESLKRQETPYIAAFQDAVLDFTNTYSSDIANFLQWWERQRSKLAIISPEEAQAVRVITVHKSKGLEYLAVIIPDAGFNFAPSRNKKEWLWVKPKIDSELPMPPYIPVEADQKLIETPHRSDYEDFLKKIALDGLNASYVAFTRAAVELYIFASSAESKVNQDNIIYALKKFCSEPESTMSGMEEAHMLTSSIESKTYLMDKEGEIVGMPDEESEEETGGEKVCKFLQFSYGEKTTSEQFQEIYDKNEKKRENSDSADRRAPEIYMENYEVHSDSEAIRFRDAELNIKIDHEENGEEPKVPEWRKLRDEGVLKHSIMSMVEKAGDLPRAILKHKIKGRLTSEQARDWEKELGTAIEKVKSLGWFGEEYTILNESTIQHKGERDRRPDRIMISKDGDAVIVDYKFGHHTDVSRYNRQVRRYMELLERTNLYRKVEGYLWYVETGEVKRVEN